MSFSFTTRKCYASLAQMYHLTRVILYVCLPYIIPIGQVCSMCVCCVCVRGMWPCWSFELTGLGLKRTPLIVSSKRFVPNLQPLGRSVGNLRVLISAVGWPPEAPSPFLIHSAASSSGERPAEGWSGSHWNLHLICSQQPHNFHWPKITLSPSAMCV